MKTLIRSSVFLCVLICNVAFADTMYLQDQQQQRMYQQQQEQQQRMYQQQLYQQQQRDIQRRQYQNQHQIRSTLCPTNDYRCR